MKSRGCRICVAWFWKNEDVPLRLPVKRTWSWKNTLTKEPFQFFTFMQWLMVCSLKSFKVLKWVILISVVLLERWQWVTQNRRNFLIETINFMQNCPLKTTQIASVMALNAQNRKIYGALSRLPPPISCLPAARVFILGMSAFVTKFNHYTKNGHC